MHEARYRESEDRVWRNLGVEREEQWLDLASSGARVRVQLSGDGPAVVFLHGGAVGGTSWAGLVADLDHYRCITVDRPGCGLSPKLEEPFPTVADMTAFYGRFVADVLDALGHDDAFLVGTSLGGFTSVHATAAHPERIRRLLLMGSVFGSDLDSIPLVMRISTIEPIGRAMAKMPPSRAAARMILRQIGLRDAMKAGRVTDDMIDWFLSNMRDTDTLLNEADTNPPIINMQGMAPEALIPDGTLAGIDVPVKLIWGDRDPMGSVALARSFSAKIPGAELDVWAYVGHAPWLDHPDRAAKELTRFFAND